MDVKEIREAFEKWMSLPYTDDELNEDGSYLDFNAGYQAALSTIDPEAIKRTVLFDAIKSISTLNQMSVESSINDDYLIGYGFGVRDCQVELESILSAEPGAALGRTKEVWDGYK